MRYGIFIVALGLVWSSQVAAGELQSVYVGAGRYIASGNVHVGTGTGLPDLRGAWRRLLRTLRHTTRIRAGLCATGSGIQSTSIL